MSKRRFYYDLETYPNCFLFIGCFEDNDDMYVFEISDRRNDAAYIIDLLNFLSAGNVDMIGFNNLNFDYPIIHDFLNSPWNYTAERAYDIAQKIIVANNDFTVRLKDRLIPQIDLLKINHFDNKMKRTRLKDLEYAMRSENLEDLPFEPGTILTDDQKDQLITYGIHDVKQTKKFGIICKPLIEMRYDLIDNGVLKGDVMNWSDVKLGTEYLVSKIGRTKCYNGRNPKQSFRTQINIDQIILDKIHFREEKFQQVLDWYKNQIIYVESKQRPKLETKLAGLNFHFGVGGVHASVNNKHYQKNDTHSILDIDVSGMYVAVAITNKFSPGHLGDDFTVAYEELQRNRAQYPKGTIMNRILKLAGNGVFGNSNNIFSCFYDPQYTFTITINGQMQLLQLVEILHLIPGLEFIQANTDGVTVYLPNGMIPLFKAWCKEWENHTGLKLEEVEYQNMWIRDVNNYIAQNVDGKLKRKGAYWYPEKLSDYEGYWNKDYSNLASIKAAEYSMRYNWPVEQTIMMIHDKFDFMLRYKVTGANKLYIGDNLTTRTCRYYVSHAGEKMTKVMPPKGKLGTYKKRNGITDEYFKKILKTLPEGAHDERIHTKNKSVYETRVSSIESGWHVKNCNDASEFDWNDLNYSYYIEEAKKLLIGEMSC